MENDSHQTRNETKKRPAFYLVKVASRQELNVALMVEKRVKSGDSPVYSIIVPPEIKGYLILETPKLSVIEHIRRDVSQLRKTVQGTLTIDDVERMIKPKSTIELISPGDMVEVIAGPFQGIKAQVLQVNKDKGDVVLNILESAYPLKVTVPGEFVKPIKKVE